MTDQDLKTNAPCERNDATRVRNNGQRNSGAAPQQVGNPQQYANARNGENEPGNTGTDTQKGETDEVKKENKIIQTDEENKMIQITQSKGTMKIVIGVEPEKPYYHVCSCKRGLLCIVQLESKWTEGNKKDSDVLKEFFEDTLGFHVEKFTSYSALEAAFNPPAETNTDTKTENDPNTKKIVGLENYYCLVICISGHGDEKGLLIECSPPKKIINEQCTNTNCSKRKTVDDIKTMFGNAKIKTLTGVPKIVILDVCRGGGKNTTEINDNDDKGPPEPDKVLPTKSSDFLFIHATTNGHIARIPAKHGSVGIQGVVSALKANWKNDHLEEMIIDARNEVAKYCGSSENGKEVRQTLETQSTLTKRLMFVESSKKKKDVPQAK